MNLIEIVLPEQLLEEFTDIEIAVEVLDGYVRLVVRDEAGELVDGTGNTYTEAAEMLAANAQLFVMDM